MQKGEYFLIIKKDKIFGVRRLQKHAKKNKAKQIKCISNLRAISTRQIKIHCQLKETAKLKIIIMLTIDYSL